MTPSEKAKELIDKYAGEIGTSDFHIPEFITGIKCADGSEAYTKILNDETLSLAKQCAIICVDEILEACAMAVTVPEWVYKEAGWYSYWHKVKEEINLHN